jgi:hypothetical protein
VLLLVFVVSEPHAAARPTAATVQTKTPTRFVRFILSP